MATAESTFPSPLATVPWLSEHLTRPELRVVDATWQSMASGKRPRVDYARERIPGAVLFDHAALAADGPFSDTRPSAAAFAEHVGALGIANDSLVIVYSQKGTAGGASRAWWLFRSFGHTRVAVLDGGLPAWKSASQPVDHGPRVAPPAQRRYTASDATRLLSELDVLRKQVADNQAQVVDARPAKYFSGADIYPSGNTNQLNITPGRIPGSLHLPSSAVVDGDTKQMKSPSALTALVAEQGIDVQRPIVTTCSLGVGACTAALALAVIGADHASVFDGAWEEWGSHPETEKVQGDPSNSDG